jgi:pSer/pThr/pTyr-binding forkhead associated (FHA) protein
MNTDQLIWTIPVALVVIASVQLLYLAWLSYAPVPKSSQANIPKIPPINPMEFQMEQQQAVPVQATQNFAPARPAAVPVNPVNDVERVKKFVVVSGLEEPMEITVPSGSFSIGRYYNLETDILVALDERSISRKHALFEGNDATKEFYLTDANSSYGTYMLINGRFEPLTPGSRQRIYNEDVVQFGNAVKVRLILPSETRASSTRL